MTYVAVELVGRGDENAMGFSVEFNPVALQWVEARLGAGSRTATLLVNGSQLKGGRVGLALALPAGQTFGAGQRVLVELGFVAPVGRGSFTTRVQLGDEPVRRELVSVAAAELPVQHASDRMRVMVHEAMEQVGEPPFKLEVAGWTEAGEMRLRLAGEAGARYRIEVSEDLARWITMETVTLDGHGSEFVETPIGSSRTRFYRAVLVR